MADVDVFEAIKAERARIENRREENRRRFPGVAAITDELSAIFGPVKVRYAVENGVEIGNKNWMENRRR